MRSKIAIPASLGVLTLMPNAAQNHDFRSSVSGGGLLDDCRVAVEVWSERGQQLSRDAIIQAAYCAGFIEAAADAGSFLGALDAAAEPAAASPAQQSIRNCAGSTVNGKELVSVVMEFLDEYPSSHEHSAISVSMLAIARAFPCPGAA